MARAPGILKGEKRVPQVSRNPPSGVKPLLPQLGAIWALRKLTTVVGRTRVSQRRSHLYTWNLWLYDIRYLGKLR